MAANSNSIAFPPDVMAAAERYARDTNRSVSSIAEEALRFYLAGDEELNANRQYHLQQALDLGLTPEEYVSKMIKEYRTEKRQRGA